MFKYRFEKMARTRNVVRKKSNKPPRFPQGGGRGNIKGAKLMDTIRETDNELFQELGFECSSVDEFLHKLYQMGKESQQKTNYKLYSIIFILALIVILLILFK